MDTGKHDWAPGRAKVTLPIAEQVWNAYHVERMKRAEICELYKLSGSTVWHITLGWYHRMRELVKRLEADAAGMRELLGVMGQSFNVEAQKPILEGQSLEDAVYAYLWSNPEARLFEVMAEFELSDTEAEQLARAARGRLEMREQMEREAEQRIAPRDIPIYWP